ncbi:MAG: HAMP domain-containing histidine kinase [Anaerolineae bacterium]|nr:HAMP domain-containing histidine kinase [Anaerolineae bacterium]
MKRLWRSLTRSIMVKWLFTLLFTGLFGIGLVWFFANRTTNIGFDALKVDQAQADFATTAQTYYKTHGSWDGFRETVDQRPSNNDPKGQANQPRDRFDGPPPIRFILTDASNTIIIDAPPYHMGDVLTDDQLARGTPITVNGKKVGTVLFAQGSPTLNPFEQRFLAQTNTGILIGAIGAALIALLVGIVLTRHFMRPLTDLTLALRAMQKGQLEQEVPVRSQDELGELTQAFNHMSKDLARANYLRRQMTADIAHDLRTPLTVISGYLEGMQDGTLKPTPTRLETMNREVIRLKRLVEDLRTLSLADAGELKLAIRPTPVDALLHEVAESFQPLFDEQALQLTVQIEPELPLVHIDQERMRQVLDNVVSNAMRYTSAGGSITLRAYRANGTVQLSVQDTGAGIPADKLPYIFERMYRVDVSRNGNDDESGLGLAIVRSIVEAHGATVAAQSEVGKGTTITVAIPVKDTPEPVQPIQQGLTA